MEIMVISCWHNQIHHHSISSTLWRWCYDYKHFLVALLITLTTSYAFTTTTIPSFVTLPRHQIQDHDFHRRGKATYNSLSSSNRDDTRLCYQQNQRHDIRSMWERHDEGAKRGQQHQRKRQQLLRLWMTATKKSDDNDTKKQNDGTSSSSSSSSESMHHNHPQLIADLPMIRLRLPDGSVGREYVAIRLKMNDQGPFTFMVDTGLTTEMITPHLQQTLGLRSDARSRSNRLQSFGAGGSTSANQLMELQDVRLCCGDITNHDEYQIPIPLHAVITDFPQEHIDPAYDPVEGMIGMELLSLYDIDFDFVNKRIRFWKPGTVMTHPEIRNGLIQIPAATINETGLIGIRITIPNHTGPPILGFLDCGSTFSIMNWATAPYLGLSSNPEDPMYHNDADTVGPDIIAVGIDGKSMKLPTKLISLTFAGNPIVQKKNVIGFEDPPKSWIPWKPIYMAIGNLPAFSLLLSPNPKQPYNGPAALIGLDILSQKRIIFEAQHPDLSRQRTLFIS